MEKSEFLSFFYKHSMHVMTAPLFAATCDDRPSKGKPFTILFYKVLMSLESFLKSKYPSDKSNCMYMYVSVIDRFHVMSSKF